MALRGVQLLSSRVSSVVRPSYRAGYATSPLLDFRRQRDRGGWKTYVDDPDAEFEVFPNERIGRQYDVNWEFNSHQVTPSEEAYRNLHHRGLVMLTPGTKNKENCVVLETTEPSDYQTFYLASEKAPKDAKIISKDAWRAAIRRVRMQLSNENAIFMHDGAVGSCPVVSVKSRVMSNTPASALQLYFLMNRAPRCVPERFDPDVVGWMFDGELDFPKEEFGINVENYTLVDLDGNRFITVGNLTQNVLKNSLRSATSNILSAKDALVIDCGVVTDGKDTGLVFSDKPVASVGNISVFSSGNTVWCPHGVSRAWDCNSLDSVPSNAQPGDLVEKIGKETRYTSKAVANPIGRVGPHPSTAFFVTADAKEPISKLTAAAASKILQSSQPETASQIESLLKQHKTTPYAINNKNISESVFQKGFSGKK